MDHQFDERRVWPADDEEFMAAWEQAEREANHDGGYVPNDAFIEANAEAYFRYERLVDRIWGIDDGDLPFTGAKAELGPAVTASATDEPPTAAMQSELGAVFAAVRR